MICTRLVSLFMLLSLFCNLSSGVNKFVLLLVSINTLWVKLEHCRVVKLSKLAGQIQSIILCKGEEFWGIVPFVATPLKEHFFVFSH